jgi:hypothetical protein
MRTAEIVANEKWIVWLNELEPVARELVMRHELYYFDEVFAGRMSLTEVVEDVRSTLLYV